MGKGFRMVFDVSLGFRVAGCRPVPHSRDVVVYQHQLEWRTKNWGFQDLCLETAHVLMSVF